MMINLIILTLLFGGFWIFAFSMHHRRYGRNYIASYHWYIRILK
ncbi:hypothetical protein HNQ56_002821 [Anaerotaenia torta]